MICVCKKSSNSRTIKLVVGVRETSLFKVVMEGVNIGAIWSV